MGCGSVAGSCLTPREASAAMALVTAATEREYHIMGFSDRFMPLNISPRMRLDDVVKRIGHLPFQGTDCSLPTIWARENGVNVSAFITYTDSETWAGNIHPAQALRQYRSEFVGDAKAVVVGMTSNGFTLADPNDRGMLDVVGFDTTAPAVIADFVRSND
jgi:60 kDa SS-A/Ro ribonucleoprotein